MKSFRYYSRFLRTVCLCVCVMFAVTFAFPPVPGDAQMIVQALGNLPLPGTMIGPSAEFTPPLVRGITVHPNNPFEFDFIINTGDENLQGTDFQEESKTLIKYFLAAVTVPDEEFWVNLSPEESSRVVPEALGRTQMGVDMLAQDYLLKQLTASLMYPEQELGRRFWERVYARAEQEYGTRDIPFDAFHKVWIVPDKAEVYEHNGSVFVTARHLTVMLADDYENHRRSLAKGGLEEDYLRRGGFETLPDNSNTYTNEILRELILPEIEREVNHGRTFAKLRQIYNSMILATWYKRALRDSLLSRVYADQNKISGIDIQDRHAAQKLYARYMEAFRTGVYNYIKEDVDEAAGGIVPRQYFSGGIMRVQNLEVKTGNLSDKALLAQRQAVLVPESESGTDQRVVWRAVAADQAMIAQVRPELRRKVFDKKTVARLQKEFADRGYLFDLENLSEIVWPELIRENFLRYHEQLKQLNEFQLNYFQNQTDVRREFIRLLLDMADRPDMPFKVFKERFRKLHVILLTGKDGKTFYDPDWWRYQNEKIWLEGERIAYLKRIAGKFKSNSEQRLSQLQAFFYRILESGKSNADKVDLADLCRDFLRHFDGFNGLSITDVLSLPSFLKDGRNGGRMYLFERGNYALFMNMVNTVLRMHGLNPVSHLDIDDPFERSVVGEWKFKNMIFEANFDREPISQRETERIKDADSAMLGSVAAWTEVALKGALTRGQEILSVHAGAVEDLSFADFLKENLRELGVQPYHAGLLSAIPAVSAGIFWFWLAGTPAGCRFRLNHDRWFLKGKKKAAKRLGDLKDDKAIDILAEIFLRHKDLALRRIAAESLGRIGRDGHEKREQVLAYLNSINFQDQGFDRTASIQILRLFAMLNRFSPVIEALGSPDQKIRAAAAGFLKDLPENYHQRPGIIQLLLSLLKDPFWKVREASEKTCRKIGMMPELMFNAYQDAFNEGDMAVRKFAILGIAQLGGALAFEFLHKYGVVDPDTLVRAATAEGLRILGDRSETTIQALRYLSRDPHTSVRTAAEEALAFLVGNGGRRRNGQSPGAANSGITGTSLPEATETQRDSALLTHALKNSGLDDDQKKFLEEYMALLLSDQKIVVVSDVHGTLALPTWYQEYGRAYELLVGQRPTEEWMDQYVVHKTEEEIMRAFQQASGKNRERVEDAMRKIREQVWKAEDPAPMPGAADFIQALVLKGIPVVALSRTEKDIVIEQLKRMGFLDYIPPVNIYHSLDDAKALEEIQGRFPDRVIILLDDWIHRMEIVKRMGGHVIGVPQGDSPQDLAVNEEFLKRFGVDFMVRSHKDWRVLTEVTKHSTPVDLRRFSEKFVKESQALGVDDFTPEEIQMLMRIIRIELEADLGPQNIDATSDSTIPDSSVSTERIWAKQDGILAGLQVAMLVFKMIDSDIKFEPLHFDGDALKKGDEILKVTGKTRSLLKAERTALNLMQRMSGIAVKTNKFVKAVEGTGAVILDTRKTISRLMDKHAVKMGGGTNHRMGLYDEVMIKDNHIAATKGKIKETVKAVRKATPKKRIIVEAATPQQVQNALDAGVDRILLEIKKLTPAQMKEAVKKVRASEQYQQQGTPKLEASGEATLENVGQIAREYDVDFISVGALTNSVEAMDISMDFVEGDSALLGENAVPGGIDFNPRQMDLRIRRDTNGIPLPLPQQPAEIMEIKGLTPVILNIIPADIPLILGLKEDETEKLVRL